MCCEQAPFGPGAEISDHYHLIKCPNSLPAHLEKVCRVRGEAGRAHTVAQPGSGVSGLRGTSLWGWWLLLTWLPQLQVLAKDKGRISLWHFTPSPSQLPGPRVFSYQIPFLGRSIINLAVPKGTLAPAPEF